MAQNQKQTHGLRESVKGFFKHNRPDNPPQLDGGPYGLEVYKTLPKGMVESLTSYGNPLVPRNREGDTPILSACRHGRVEMVKALLKESPGPDLKKFAIKSPERGYGPLHLAARAGNAEIVQILLEAGAYKYDSPVLDADGSQVMHLAVYGAKSNVEKCVKTVETLTGCGAGGKELKEQLKTALVDDPDKHKRTALHMAIKTDCDNRVIRALVNGGARIDIEDNVRQSPLYLAVLKKDDELVKILWDPENINDESVFFNAVASKKKDRLGQLLKANYNSEELDEWGRSAFDVAINTDIRQLLKGKMPASKREAVVVALKRDENWCHWWRDETIYDSTDGKWYECKVCECSLANKRFHHCCTCTGECKNSLKLVHMCEECFKIRNCKDEHKTSMRFLGNGILSLQEASPNCQIWSKKVISTPAETERDTALISVIHDSLDT